MLQPEALAESRLPVNFLRGLVFSKFTVWAPSSELTYRKPRFSGTTLRLHVVQATITSELLTIRPE